ncbi:unnamed protein product [Staurois parvus]|uniref:Uncharacterized protein n=1 Tax=Staurois parvus TaxID=386267 RepID=A0ABN9GPS9_9NEOB|nr:unnamed protein product [Staurois parvus]
MIFFFFLAFRYVNSISFRRCLTVRSQTLTPISAHLFLICFVHFFVFKAYCFKFSILTL